jgi:hypothetical protein
MPLKAHPLLPLVDSIHSLNLLPCGKKGKSRRDLICFLLRNGDSHSLNFKLTAVGKSNQEQIHC